MATVLSLHPQQNTLPNSNRINSNTGIEEQRVKNDKQQSLLTHTVSPSEPSSRLQQLVFYLFNFAFYAFVASALPTPAKMLSKTILAGLLPVILAKPIE